MMLAFAVGNMAQAAALNWMTFIKALIASLLAKSSECHSPNPTYRFQDLTSSGTNVASQFCKKMILSIAGNPSSTSEEKKKKKVGNMVISDTSVCLSSAWLCVGMTSSVILPNSITMLHAPTSPRCCYGHATST